MPGAMNPQKFGESLVQLCPSPVSVTIGVSQREEETGSTLTKDSVELILWPLLDAEALGQKTDAVTNNATITEQCIIS